MRWAPLALAAAFLLAGCSGPGKPEKSDLQASLDGYDVEATGQTAAMRGIVVDEAIRPIGNASIAIPSLGLGATTQKDGLFGFEGLTPGVYFLNVSAPGYLPVQQSAELAAGQIVDVRVLLNLDPRPQPYHTTLKFEWFDQAGVTLVDFAVDLVDRTFLNDTLPDACDLCYFQFDVDGPYETMVLEAVWEDSVAFPARPTSYYWVLEAYPSDDYEDDYFQSPGRVEIDGERFPGDTHYGLGMSGDEDWVTFQQDAQLFVTVFYNEPAPEGWSFVAGDS